MQNKIFVITIFLVVLLSLFHSGEAIRCYQCNEQFTKKSQVCPDTPANGEEVECNKATACIRYTKDVEGKTYIGRGCSNGGVCEATGKILNYKSCSECDKDLCNDSAANAVSIVMMLTSGVITLWTIQ